MDKNKNAQEKLLKVQKCLYDREYSKFKKYRLENWRISYIKRIFNALDLKENKIFLDIGVGGSGYTVIEAARNNVRAIGIDVSSEGMRTAHRFAKHILGKNFSLCDFIVCSATHLPFKSKSISMIASIAVLEHIPDDKRVIDEISRIIEDKGELFITVPNAYQRMLPIFWIYCYFNDRLVGHLRHYKAETLVKDFSEKGFSVKGVYYHAHIVKVIQFLLHAIFKQLREPNSRIWWKLEEMDYRLYKLPVGMQLSMHLKKNK
jgi:ubiquinone/menaquinone biosynthesis C-methylase UbiE